MTDQERHARKLIELMKEAGTSAGEIMMWGAIQGFWLKPDNANRDDLLAGVEYAADQGWVEQVDDTAKALRLTEKGAAVRK